MNYIIAYDISSNQIRKKVAEYLEAKGIRINKSVFLITESSIGVEQLQQDLAPIIKKGDEVFITPMCNTCLGKGIFLNRKPKDKREQFTIFT